MASCFTSTQATSATPVEGSGTTATASTRLTTIGCAQPDVCECTPLVAGTVAHETTSPVNFVIPLGSEGTAESMFAPSWAVGQVVGTDFKVTGNAPVGKYTLVYTLKNECSEACVIVDLTVKAACPAPSNITKDVFYNENTLAVNYEIGTPKSSTVVSSSVDELSAEAYETSTAIVGTLKQPLPASYAFQMQSPCGPYTISGNILKCVPPRLESAAGPSQLERDVASTMTWVVIASGDVMPTVVNGIPSGMTYLIQQNTPAVGKATITVSGVPTETECSGSDCEVRIALSSQCGTLLIKKKYTYICRAPRPVRDVGSLTWPEGSAVNYCKAFAGFGPMEIVSYEDLPRGLELNLDESATNAGEWNLCVTGNYERDPCEEYKDGKICKCFKAIVRNECGEKEVEICYTVTYVLPRPIYCVGMWEIVGYNSDDIPIVNIWGVVPGSSVTVYNGDGGVAQTIPIDNDGYAMNVQLTGQFAAGISSCITMAHPSCALLKKGVATVACKNNEPAGGGGDPEGGDPD